MIANRYVFNNSESEFDIKAGEKPALKIPDKRYDVYVPSEALLHPDEARWMMSVNGEEYTKQSYNSIVHCVLSIEQMLEIYQDGYKISLVRADDASNIYYTIQGFLKRVEELYASEMENVFKIDDRIRILDKFADSIYRNNGKTLNKNVVDAYAPVKALEFLESKFNIENRKTISQMQVEREYAPIGNSMPFNKYVSEAYEEYETLNKVKPFEHYQVPKIEFGNESRESVYDNIERLKAQREALKLNSSRLVNKDEYGKFNL